MRPVIYIAHPLSGDWDANLVSARQYMLAAALVGYAPLAPYLMWDGLLDDDRPEDRALGIDMDVAILERCEEVWLCGPRISSGMDIERRYADARGITVRRVETLAAITPLARVT